MVEHCQRLKKPTAKGKEGASESSSGSTSTSESEITVDGWKIDNAQAHHILNIAVDHIILHKIATLDTAANAWQALKDLYNRETPNTTVTLLKTALNRKLGDGASVHGRQRELYSEEKAHRVLKEITGDNSSTVATAWLAQLRVPRPLLGQHGFSIAEAQLTCATIQANSKHSKPTLGMSEASMAPALPSLGSEPFGLDVAFVDEIPSNLHYCTVF